MQQQSFILSLRQGFRWLPKVSLPKLLSSICTRTAEVGGANCRRKHPPCPVCGKASFLHHYYDHYSNYRCTDKSGIIPFLYGSPLPLPLRLCQLFSASTISSVCVIPFKLSSRLCQCFISARIHFGISVSYLKPPLISRFLIPLSATGALSLTQCLTICAFSLFPY